MMHVVELLKHLQNLDSQYAIMIKKYFKHFLKNSKLVHKLSAVILFLYLKLAYLTSKWEFIYPAGIDQKQMNAYDGVLFAMWHNRLTFSMHIFKKYDNLWGLASPHTDGKLLIDVLKYMGYKIIEGSTNRNPTGALRAIIASIDTGKKVMITPDGPRGPKYKINSAITKLGHKYNKPVIPVSCAATKYFQLKSWDRMMVPKLFGKITVIFGSPLNLSGNEVKDNELLEGALMNLSAKAKLEIKP